MSIDTIITLDLWMIVPLFLFGSILHFTYNWSRHNKHVAIFSAVNESYWEHIKIAFWPVFLLAAFEYAAGGHHYLSFLPAKTIALYSIPVSMIVIVFVYKHFTKRNILALDILAFLVSVALAQTISLSLLGQLNADVLTAALSVPFLLALVMSFVLFTLHPPREPDFFKDPLSEEYGLKAHR